MKLWVTFLTFIALVVLGVTPVYATSDTTEPVQEEPALTLSEAVALAEENGLGFQATDSTTLPTRTELMAAIATIRAQEISSVQPSGAVAYGNSEKRSCRHNVHTFAAIFQHLTLTLGTFNDEPAYIDLTRHDVELRTWLIGQDWIQAMWITHLEKDDYQVNGYKWRAIAEFRLWYRFLNFTMYEDHWVQCTVWPE